MLHSKLFKRVIGAIISITTLVLLYLFFSELGLILTIYIFLVWTTFEIQRFVFDHFCPSTQLIPRILFSFVTLLIFTLQGFSIETSTLIPIAVLFYYCFLILFSREKTIDSLFKTIAYSSFGFFYGALLPAFILKILISSDNGDKLFFFLLIMVFIGDTFAYLVGKTLGRKKLAPRLSPNKTLLGSLGGAFGTSAVSLGFGFFYFFNSPWIIWLCLGLLIALTAQLGDIFESLIKRAAKVKDSGKYFIGHGGALDRLDGLFFSAPILYLFIQYFI